MAKAQELYFLNGLKSVTMDELARFCGITKKSIYQHFADKHELINALIHDKIERYRKMLQNLPERAANVIEEIWMETYAFVAEWGNAEPRFFYELKKFYPTLWQQLESFRKETVLVYLIDNLERGIKEGIYREDLNIPFVADLRIQQLLSILHPSRMNQPQISATHLAEQLTEFYLYGITTEKQKSNIKSSIHYQHEK